MGKRQIRVVAIRKWITLVLLVVVSLLIAWLIYWLSGKAYSTEEEPIVRLMREAMRGQTTPTRNAVLSDLTPVVANILLFMPWGFLAFLLFDSPARSRAAAYIATVILGGIFAAVLIVWQEFLPTRVTGPLDGVINVAGAFGGALAGHLRKRIRIQFET